VAAYATLGEYREVTGDAAADAARATAMLEGQSAKLRAALGIGEGRALTADQALLARDLVCDAVRKALAAPSASWGELAPGVSQTSLTANGFTESVTLSNPSGAAYFDRSTLAALRRSLGLSQRAGTVAPFYGGRP